MAPENPAELDLVLVGGGHAHALALRMLAMERPAGLRITLISPSPFTPYSGMLPGLLAGHYTFEETHIDLALLCQWADVRFFADTVTAMDPQRRVVTCAKRGEVGYDLVSIDIGSQPELDSVPGAREHTIPVKPVAGLWERWHGRDESAIGGGSIAVVGGGAGSVEIALALAHRLRDAAVQIDLYCGAARVLPGYTKGVRRAVEQALRDRGVGLHCDRKVTRVEKGELHFGTASPVAFHTAVWCTGASAAPWIADSGLPVDERGFMAVNDTLQSTEFADVFGCGDIATQLNHPRPKAGVYAVRQAPVLAHNLVAAARGAALKLHRPQQRFLSLLSLGDQQAVAERNGLHARGAWVWRWKDRIDRQFMERFSDLPSRVMKVDASNRVGSGPTQATCGGCGAKVGADVLAGALEDLRKRFPDATPAASDLDDAAPVATDGDGFLQSVDALRALVDDPWRMGRIAAQHALSDLYASGATPHSAQALVTLPFATKVLLQRDLRLVLAGALTVFSDADCRLIGGHTMQGPELQLGFAVNGSLQGGERLGKRGGQAGDQLLLTGSLGAGALLAAHMQGRADGRHVDGVLSSMEDGNREAAGIARKIGVRALTDVTGFGLAGHLAEMLDDSVTAVIDLEALPAYVGALEAMGSGVFSTLHEGNREALVERCELLHDGGLRQELLFDPQTGGGLLMAVPSEVVDDAAAAFAAARVTLAIIGELRPADGPGGLIQLTRNSRMRSL